jgi:hypothetical protein
MALLATNNTRFPTVNRTFSGVTTVVGIHRKESFYVPHTHLNWCAGWHTISGVSDRSSVPQGASHPVAYKWARKAGGLAGINSAEFSLTGSVALVAGRALAGDATLTITVPDAQLNLVSSAIGSASFSISTAGTLDGALFAAGAATFSVITNTPTLGAISSATGAATFSLTGELALTAIGNLEGNILPNTGDELTADEVALAVVDMLLPNLEVINQGVKKASILVPHTTDL